MATMIVYSVDMWGHVPADCCAAYGCKCVNALDEDEHNDDACDCGQDMNEHFRCGSFEIDDEHSDDADVLKALGEEGYLSEKGVAECEIEDDGSEGPWRVQDKQGRCVLMVGRE